LEVSLNAQQFSSANVLWRWLLPPRAIGVSPTAGPVDGETLVTMRGLNLWRVPELQVRCSTNQLAHEHTQLALA
jgi:hypothetical protein